MLLVHRCGSGRLQYVVSRYFSSVWEPIDGLYEYTWDWGHYFDRPDALFDAVHYWEREVLDVEDRDEEGAAV